MSPVGGGGLRQCGGCGLLTGNLQTALLACTRHHCTPALHPPPLHSSCPLVLQPCTTAPLHHTHPRTRDQTHMFCGHTALSNHPGHQPPRGPWCIFWSSVYKSTIDNFASIKLSSGQFSFHSSWVALFWIPVTMFGTAGCLRHVRLRCRGAEQSTGAVTPHIVNTGCTLQHSARCISLISPVMEQKCLKSSNFCPPHTKTRQLQWRLLVKFPSFLVTGGRKLSSSIYQSMPLSGHNCHTLYGPWWILI